MANDFTNVTPKLLASGLLALRQMAIMPLLVNRAYDAMAGEQGSTIDVPLPPSIAVDDVTPGTTSGTTADILPGKVSIALDKWKVAKFYMTDKDEMEVMNGILPQAASDALKNLANQVDTDILALYKAVYGYVGTAGTTPFNATTKTKDATDARVVLNQQLAPLNDRRIVVDPTAEGNALQLQMFTDASWAGTAMGIVNGTVGTKLGFNWMMDQNIPTHTAGTITTGLIAKASTAQAVDDKTIVCTTAASTGACALKKGDIITFAGHTQTYTLTADATQASAATDVTLNIEPGLKVALAGSEDVTVKASHVVNLAFQRDAFAFVNRPLKTIDPRLGSITQSAVDPVSGIALRLEVSREYKRTLWAWDILYGCQCIRPELACRIAG